MNHACDRKTTKQSRGLRFVKTKIIIIQLTRSVLRRDENFLKFDCADLCFAKNETARIYSR